MASSTLLTRIEAALHDGRMTVEAVRRFLDAGPQAVRTALRTRSTGPRAAEVPRVEDLLPGLLRDASERIELSTGYRYLFENEPGVISRIATVIEQERQCCRSLRFQMALQPNRGPITLDVSGPESARAFLAGLGAPDLEKAREFVQNLDDERRKAWLHKAG
jgi:hypothetical protein